MGLKPISYISEAAGPSRQIPAPLVDASDFQPSDGTFRQIAVIIPVLDDPRIFRCLDSIDVPDVELVIVSNGSSPEFNKSLAALNRPRTKIVYTPVAGIGRAYNLGIAETDRPWVLMMDADCVFEPGSIRALAAGMSMADFVRGRVIFDTSSLQTRIPARIRRFTEDGTYSRRVTAYSPPLLYRKECIEQMGGQHFEDSLEWREDREFEIRRRKAGIPVSFAAAGVIHHAPLSIRADLRSVRAYGRSETAGRRLGFFPVEPRLQRLLKTLKTGRRLLVTNHAIDTALYLVVRRAAFNWGRYLEMRNSRGSNDMTSGASGPEHLRRKSGAGD